MQSALERAELHDDQVTFFRRFDGVHHFNDMFRVVLECGSKPVKSIPLMPSAVNPRFPVENLSPALFGKKNSQRPAGPHPKNIPKI